jgi:opacity protein-like surface antigen
MGANGQSGRWVFGLSAGIDSEIARRGQLHPDWIATMSARFGYAATDRFLSYAALGPALANFGASSGGTASVVGWTAGVGFNYRLSDNWSATAGLNYYDFDFAPQNFAGSAHWSQFELKVGLQYLLPSEAPSRSRLHP